ncbi:MAG TPA: hypothetical protein VFX98_05270 [Longimicrobiaceae bacterium]|nr:hypothetical protein [Longimicrobiaceae bacterium]
MTATAALFTCEGCGARFPAGTGATCARCRRRLCPAHFGAAGLLPFRMGRRVCEDCRRGTPRPP